MDEIKCGIYKIISPSHRIYIGQAVDIGRRIKEYEKITCKEQRRLYESLKKYGFKNHVIEVQELCEIEKLNERERYWQEFYDVLSSKGLNCRLTDSNNKSGKLSDETKKKISEGNKGKVRSEQVRKEMSERNKGKKLSDQTKQKIKEARKNQIILPRSEETKNKISKSNKGRKHSDEAKRKISEASRNMSEETKAKIGAAHKNKIVSEEAKNKISFAKKGFTHSEETKRKMRENKIGKKRGKYKSKK